MSRACLVDYAENGTALIFYAILFQRGNFPMSCISGVKNKSTHLPSVTPECIERQSIKKDRNSFCSHQLMPIPARKDESKNLSSSFIFCLNATGTTRDGHQVRRFFLFSLSLSLCSKLFSKAIVHYFYPSISFLSLLPFLSLMLVIVHQCGHFCSILVVFRFFSPLDHLCCPLLRFLFTSKQTTRHFRSVDFVRKTSFFFLVCIDRLTSPSHTMIRENEGKRPFYSSFPQKP